MFQKKTDDQANKRFRERQQAPLARFITHRKCEIVPAVAVNTSQDCVINPAAWAMQMHAYSGGRILGRIRDGYSVFCRGAIASVRGRSPARFITHKKCEIIPAVACNASCECLINPAALRATEDLIFFPADHLPALARHFQVQTTPGQRSEGAKHPFVRKFPLCDISSSRTDEANAEPGGARSEQSLRSRPHETLNLLDVNIW